MVIKLYGRCKWNGECVCGNCLFYPANATSILTITYPDGRIRYEVVQLIEPASVWNPPIPKARRIARELKLADNQSTN